MTEPTATPVSKTTEFRLTGYPHVKYRWGSGRIRPAFVAIACLDTRRSAHLYGTWIREDGEQTDDLVDQLYRHDDDWPEELAALASTVPFNEKPTAFQRGYAKGHDSAKKAAAEYTAQLETALAELRQDRDPDALRARIADLAYVLHGYSRRRTGAGHGTDGTSLHGLLADALGRLETVQRELAVLKGVQPSDATGLRPSV